MPAIRTKPQVLAFYLPQYHPIPENDAWWGVGFTDWLRVVQARPRFSGHYQPHLPRDLGFYDLRLPMARELQANLAAASGISGFVYYHYWFSGKRLLSLPLDEILRTRRPDFPFCLCWANESWTNTWGPTEGSRSGEATLIEQTYNHNDHLDHIKWLGGVFRDSRYIRHNGRPVFLIFRASLVPQVIQVLKLWKDYCHDVGEQPPYFLCVESFREEALGTPEQLGFDASVEFQPRSDLRGSLLDYPLFSDTRDLVYDYKQAVALNIGSKTPSFLRYPCVMPGWDNTARRSSQATIYHNTQPTIYKQWLYSALKQAKQLDRSESYVFINAWNEWAEGCHLEPDIRWGSGFLKATRQAIDM